MIRTARFCSLSNRPILNPHAKIEYCRCGRIKELYKTRRMCVGRKFFRRHIIPRVRAILFEIFCMCGFQLRCSSIVSPRKLNSLTLSIVSEFIFKVGMMLFIFRWWWWKIMNLVLFTIYARFKFNVHRLRCYKSVAWVIMYTVSVHYHSYRFINHIRKFDTYPLCVETALPLIAICTCSFVTDLPMSFSTWTPGYRSFHKNAISSPSNHR